MWIWHAHTCWADCKQVSAGRWSQLHAREPSLNLVVDASMQVCHKLVLLCVACVDFLWWQRIGSNVQDQVFHYKLDGSLTVDLYQKHESPYDWWWNMYCAIHADAWHNWAPQGQDTSLFLTLLCYKQHYPGLLVIYTHMREMIEAISLYSDGHVLNPYLLHQPQVTANAP